MTEIKFTPEYEKRCLSLSLANRIEQRIPRQLKRVTNLIDAKANGRTVYYEFNAIGDRVQVATDTETIAGRINALIVELQQAVREAQRISELKTLYDQQTDGTARKDQPEAEGCESAGA